jgi:hypothetical protein
MINPKLSTQERTTSSDSAATLTNPTWMGPEHRYVSPSHVHTNTKMPHECDVCGETFTTLSRLRLHDCPEAEPESRDPLSSFDAFLDSISDALEADMQRNAQEREKRGTRSRERDLEDQS